MAGISVGQTAKEALKKTSLDQVAQRNTFPVETSCIEIPEDYLHQHQEVDTELETTMEMGQEEIRRAEQLWARKPGRLLSVHWPCSAIKVENCLGHCEHRRIAHGGIKSANQFCLRSKSW